GGRHHGQARRHQGVAQTHFEESVHGRPPCPRSFFRLDFASNSSTRARRSRSSAGGRRFTRTRLDKRGWSEPPHIFSTSISSSRPITSSRLTAARKTYMPPPRSRQTSPLASSRSRNLWTVAYSDGPALG